MSSTMTAHQRARLLRSHRKLEAILGETPVVESIPRSQRREARLFGSNKAQPLILHLQIPDDKRASIISIASVAPRSPLSPTVANGDYRRKKLAKLARTLGENVPPELVFPNLSDDNATARRQRRVQRGRSWSVDGPVPTGLDLSGSLEKPEIDDYEIYSTLHSLKEGNTVHRSVSTDSDRTSVYSSTSFLHLKGDSAKSSFDGAVHPHLTLRKGWGRRKEREWSGEWNHEMDSVINRLRSLKTK